ncbi:uncharacterized protein VP01_2384g1 [Puccinia sorghi]|uniref:Retroviral polymerase SH3-like domain-containing protein n=1 Tax=Puccinia sorghi TaxID=27349 RepID=A0A0L6V8S7_9BASI|nr:uncharacterized protein VP01_2384g1 [Puccinia sorghi]
MSCACNYAITIPVQCAFGIVIQMEHQIPPPPKLMLSTAFIKMPKDHSHIHDPKHPESVLLLTILIEFQIISPPYCYIQIQKSKFPKLTKCCNPRRVCDSIHHPSTLQSNSKSSIHTDNIGVSPTGGLSSASAPFYIPQLAIYYLNHNMLHLQSPNPQDLSDWFRNKHVGYIFIIIVRLFLSRIKAFLTLLLPLLPFSPFLVVAQFYIQCSEFNQSCRSYWRRIQSQGIEDSFSSQSPPKYPASISSHPNGRKQDFQLDENILGSQNGCCKYLIPQRLQDTIELSKSILLGSFTNSVAQSEGRIDELYPKRLASSSMNLVRFAIAVHYGENVLICSCDFGNSAYLAFSGGFTSIPRLFLQALTSPQVGMTHTQISNLILAAAEKRKSVSNQQGGLDITDEVVVQGEDLECQVKVVWLGMDVVGSLIQTIFVITVTRKFTGQKVHWKFDFPHKVDYQAQSGGGRGLFNKPESPLAPAIWVSAADATGIVDTGATNHQDVLLKLAALNGTVTATHIRSIRMSSTHSMKRLDNFLYFPDIWGLISLGKLLDDGFQCGVGGSALGLVLADCFSPLVKNPVSPSLPAVMKLSVEGLFRASTSSHGFLFSARLVQWPREKGDLVVSDVLGLVDPADIFGNQYFLTLCDHATTFLYCFLLKPQAEVETKLQHALTIIRTHSGAPKAFQQYLFTIPPNSWTNGQTPLELWSGFTPQTDNIYPFGVKAYVHVPDETCKKLDDRAWLCYLVGYLEGRCWYFWDGHLKQFISSSVAQFLDYSSKPCLTANICDPSSDLLDHMIDKIPQISDLDIPKNLKHDFDVWEVLEEDPNLKIAGSCWVFAMKQNSDNMILWDEVKMGMEKELKIKWEYGISRVVGIDVERKNVIWLSQYHLLSQVVKEAEKYFAKSIWTVWTPLPDEQLVTCFNQDHIKTTQYQHFIMS